MRHKWKRQYYEDWEEEVLVPHSIEVCLKCGTTRSIVAIVGIRYHRALRTYLREDGIRFTGHCPGLHTFQSTDPRPRLYRSYRMNEKNKWID